MTAERIKELRKSHNLTQKELATRLQTSDKNIWVYENGKANPPVEILVRMAKLFDVSVDYLMGLEDDFGVKITAANVADNYTAEERQIIEAYRELNGPGQKLVKDVIKNLQAGSRAATSTENKSDKRA